MLLGDQALRSLISQGPLACRGRWLCTKVLLTDLWQTGEWAQCQVPPH